MAAINYKTFHNGLRDSIAGYSSFDFHYWEPSKWFDLELGLFPQSGIQNGFTLRLPNQLPDPEYTVDDYAILSVEIPFALKLHDDLYLEALHHCQAAVDALRDVTVAGMAPHTIARDTWDSQYIPAFENFGGIVEVTFTPDFTVEIA